MSATQKKPPPARIVTPIADKEEPAEQQGKEAQEAKGKTKVFIQVHRALKEGTTMKHYGVTYTAPRGGGTRLFAEIDPYLAEVMRAAGQCRIDGESEEQESDAIARFSYRKTIGSPAPLTMTASEMMDKIEESMAEKLNGRVSATALKRGFVGRSSE